MRDLTSATQAGRTRSMKKITVVLATTLLLSGCGAPKVRSGNPGKPGPPEKVELVWKQATNEWKVKLNGGSEQDPKSAHTNLAKNTGPTMFEVDIRGGGSSPPPFKDGGFSVWEGQGQKSVPQQGINTTQILGPVITKNGTLVFWDFNQGGPVTLNYQFNF